MIDKLYKKIGRIYEITLLILAMIFLTLLIGCAALQNAVTPAYVDKPALKYIQDQNIPCDVPRFWWMSISDAETVDKLLDYSHDQRQVMFERAKEDDRSWYAIVKGQHKENLAGAYALRQQLFTPEGAVGLLSTTGLGLIVGALGISKPSDKREIEKLKNGNGNGKTETKTA